MLLLKKELSYNKNMLDLLLSFFGLVVGIFSLMYLSIALYKGPEALGGSIGQLIVGIGIIVVAFVWNLMVGLFKVNIFDVHHLFMAISIIFFANAARKLYKFGK